ncbi:hypothetical protein ACC708_36085, partial [Rhizobium ruizarguesonis]
MTRITDLRFFDLRFPTSQSLDGSDSMNPDPDYSAAYVILDTDAPDLAVAGDIIGACRFLDEEGLGE